MSEALMLGADVADARGFSVAMAPFGDVAVVSTVPQHLHDEPAAPGKGCSGLQGGCWRAW